MHIICEAVMRWFLITSQVPVRYGAFCPSHLRIKLQNVQPLSCTLEGAPQLWGTQQLMVQSFDLFCFLCYLFLCMGTWHLRCIIFTVYISNELPNATMVVLLYLYLDLALSGVCLTRRWNDHECCQRKEWNTFHYVEEKTLKNKNIKALEDRNNKL